MADDPGYRAAVTCTQKMQARSSAGQGTRNDAKALCIGVIGDRYRAEPKGNYDTLADCILGAPDEASSKACAASAPGSHLATIGAGPPVGWGLLRAAGDLARPEGRFPAV